MHPTIRVKKKLNIEEMSNNWFKRQEAAPGVFLLSTPHMSKTSLLHHNRGLHRVA